MNISSFALMVIATFLISTFQVYCWKEITENRKAKINFNYFLLVFLCTIITAISNAVFSQPLKLIIIYILLIAINYFFVNKDLRKAIIVVTISEITIWLSEFSFAIILSLVYKGNIQNFTQQTVVYIGMNLYITLFSFMLHKLKLTIKLYKILSPKKNQTEMEYIIYSIMIVFITIIATVETYMNLSFVIVSITNTIMAIVFITIIISSTKVKENYNKINYKYQTSISSLKEYEVMIDKFRINTHENKNEFLTIRNMIKDGEANETVIKYIDKLVDNKIKDNDKIMKKTAKIPSGGLRATIYSKLCLMDKLKIKYTLNISREIRTTNLIDLDEELVLKICKILGVFLDNAIEAVKKLKKREISIDIYLIENVLCVDITNNFKGRLDLEKIGNAKYTTKGENHGYGLALVNQLLDEEKDKLENERSINKDTFTQTLKIKMQN